MNVLITSVGRCNRLLRDFRQALPDGGLLFAADASTAAPALCEADRTFLIPPCTDPSYVDRLLEICGKNDVGLLVPRLDPEYAVLAGQRARFLALGTVPIVSEPRILELCEDKVATNHFLADCGLRTPRTWLTLVEARQALDSEEVSYPVVVKPRFGVASVGFEEVSDARELALVYELALMRVGFDISGPGGGAWAVDFRPGSEGVYHEMGDCTYRYSFASRWARPLIGGDSFWRNRNHF